MKLGDFIVRYMKTDYESKDWVAHYKKYDLSYNLRIFEMLREANKKYGKFLGTFEPDKPQFYSRKIENIYTRISNNIEMFENHFQQKFIKIALDHND